MTRRLLCTKSLHQPITNNVSWTEGNKTPWMLINIGIFWVKNMHICGNHLYAFVAFKTNMSSSLSSSASYSCFNVHSFLTLGQRWNSLISSLASCLYFPYFLSQAEVLQVLKDHILETKQQRAYLSSLMSLVVMHAPHLILKVDQESRDSEAIHLKKRSEEFC